MSNLPDDPSQTGSEHPVEVFAERLSTRLGQVAGFSLSSMDAASQRRTLVAVAKARAQLDALALRLLAEAETSQACLETGAATAAGWVAVQTRQTRREARADLNLATRLESLPLLASGMAAGGVNLAQARAIVAALDQLPTRGEFTVSAEQVTAAEAHLVQLAGTHDAVALRALGHRLVEVIAPDVAEAFEGRRLEAEEAAAARRTRFVIWTDDEGTTHGRFRIPARHGQMLRKAIQSLTNPVRPNHVRPNTSAPTRSPAARSTPISRPRSATASP